MPSHLNKKDDSNVETLSVGLQQSSLSEGTKSKEQQEQVAKSNDGDDSDEGCKKGRPYKLKALSIEPQEIANQLEDGSCSKQTPLLIDVRPLEQFEKSRIKSSINVNLPSLLIKRYQRGVVSNFNLESFITTAQGIDYYNRWLQDTQKQKQSPLCIVYDDHMNQEQQYETSNNNNNSNHSNSSGNSSISNNNKINNSNNSSVSGSNSNSNNNNAGNSSSAWTLISVLQKSQYDVIWLRKGYQAFVDWDFTGKYLEGSEFNRSASPPLPIPSCSTENSNNNNNNNSSSSSSSNYNSNSLINSNNDFNNNSSSSSSYHNHIHHHHNSNNNNNSNNINNNNNNQSSSNAMTMKKKRNKKPIHPNTMQLKMPMPMISKSATTLSNVNSNINVQRRASLFSLDTSLKSKNPSNNTNSKLSMQRRFDQDNNNFNNNNNNSNNNSFNNYYINNNSNSGDQTPKTEAEYEFVISEVIPGFLFLGPEIVNSDQLLGLSARSIQRILNMAEECDDDVPGLKDTFVYTKVAARDTVEMKNIDETLKKAVHVINDSKKHHAPIYVHCQAGKSRSVAAVLAYLVLSEHWTLKRAYRHVVKVRPNISPNIGFVAELMKMEEAVHGQVSNFAAIDWHLIDFANPPSPDTQREMGRLERAWKRDRSNSRGSSYYFPNDPSNSGEI